MLKTGIFTSIIFTMLFGFTQIFAADTYIFLKKDIPGADYTEAYDISNMEQIVGSYSGSSTWGFRRGYVRLGDLVIPSDSFSAGTSANGISNGNGVAGCKHISAIASGDDWFIEFDILPTWCGREDPNDSCATIFTDINNSLVTIGLAVYTMPYWGDQCRAYLADSTYRGFFYQGGDSYSPFLVTGGGIPHDRCLPYSINDLGQIVGYYYGDTRKHGFLREVDGTGFIIDFSSYESVALGINNYTEIVGYYEDENYLAHGFIFTPYPSTYTTIDVPDALHSYVTGINDFGTIVGFYKKTQGGPHHAFLARLGEIPDCPADFDQDRDSDGSDLATFATGTNTVIIALETLATNFGKADCVLP